MVLLVVHRLGAGPAIASNAPIAGGGAIMVGGGGNSSFLPNLSRSPKVSLRRQYVYN